MLEAAESPLLVADKGIRPIDLLMAVKICSGQAIDKLTWKDSWYLGKMSGNEDYFAEQIELFSKYVLVESWPKFWEKRHKSSDTSGSPWVLTVVTSLISNGIPEDRAWSMPECQAVWLNSSFAIIKGAELKVLTTEDEALISKLRNRTMSSVVKYSVEGDTNAEQVSGRVQKAMSTMEKNIQGVENRFKELWQGPVPVVRRPDGPAQSGHQRHLGIHRKRTVKPSRTPWPSPRRVNPSTCGQEQSPLPGKWHAVGKTPEDRANAKLAAQALAEEQGSEGGFLKDWRRSRQGSASVSWEY